MKRRVVSTLMAIIMLCSMYYLAKVAAEYTLSNGVSDKKKCVVIDAGHGGNDPGKIGVNGALEKDINLQIALRVKTLLEQNDVEVLMTREEDKGLYDENSQNKKVQDMKERIAFIEKANVPMVVSIHQNSYSDAGIHGAQVFYFTSSQEGKKAAEIMQKQLVEGMDPDNTRQAKANDSYFLLKKSPVTTIIVECGFLSNYEEAELLKDVVYQEKVAWNITMGILKYLNQI